MSDAPVMISIRNLKKSFGDLHVLKGIDLDVRRGEKVVVLGPSGSGKSTMLRCINALEDADSGTITVDGVEVTSRRTNINRLREHLGMVFQRFNLWPHKTVLENDLYSSGRRPHHQRFARPGTARQLRRSDCRLSGDFVKRRRLHE